MGTQRNERSSRRDTAPRKKAGTPVPQAFRRQCRQRLAEGDLSPGDLARLMAAYANLVRAESLRAAHRRRRAARAEAARHAPGTSGAEPADALASPDYGRHPDGRLRTRGEFIAALRDVAELVYGVALPESASDRRRPPVVDDDPADGLPSPPDSGRSIDSSFGDP